MGFATTENGHIPLVNKSSDRRVVRAMLIGSWYAVISQSIDTTEELWIGLSETDAKELCISSESSILGGQRSYLGAAVVKSSSSPGASWLRCDSCWGTRVVSNMSKIGDSNMFRVKRVTTVYDVFSTTGIIEKL